MATLLRLVWPALRPQRSALVGIYLAMVVLALSSASLAFLSGPAVALFFGAETSLPRPGWTVAWLAAWWAEAGRSGVLLPLLLVLNSVIKGVAQTCQFTWLGWVSLRTQSTLRAQTFARLLRETPAFFAERRQGDVLSRLTHDLVIIEQAVFYGLGSLLRDSLAVLVLIGMLVVHDPQLSMALLLTVPLALWPLAVFGRWLKRASRGSQDAQGSIAGICHETLMGLVDIQLNQQEERQRSALQQASKHHEQAMRRSYLVRAARTPTMEVIGAVILGLGMAVLARQSSGVDHGTQAAHYVTFLAGMVLIYDPLKKLGQMGEFVHAGAAAAERLADLHVTTSPPVADSDEPTLQDLDLVQRAPDGPAVAFSHVSFAYREQPVLSDVSFAVPVGQKVALVGPSGGGKSTLLRLLCRLWSQQSGEITLFGRDHQALPVDVVRRHLSVVGQDASLFWGSVAQNIALGRPSASRSDIVEAAEMAGARGFIERLPQRFDTLLGERGAQLSGGQRQRLAIARAFLRDAPILLLDEATSQLDHDSQRKVQVALASLMRRRTTLMVAHRLSTVQDADRIIVLAGGRIIEEGRHAALIGQGGTYARWARHEAMDIQSPITPSVALEQLS